jgi:hypothetical protein
VVVVEAAAGAADVDVVVGAGAVVDVVVEGLEVLVVVIGGLSVVVVDCRGTAVVVVVLAAPAPAMANSGPHDITAMPARAIFLR